MLESQGLIEAGEVKKRFYKEVAFKEITAV